MKTTHKTLRTAAAAFLVTAAFPITSSFAQEIAPPPVVASEPAPAPEAPPPVFQPAAPVVQPIPPEATGPARVAPEARAVAPTPDRTRAPVRTAPAPWAVPPAARAAPAVLPPPLAVPAAPVAAQPPVAADPLVPAVDQTAPSVQTDYSGWLVAAGAALLAALAGFAMLMRRRRPRAIQPQKHPSRTVVRAAEAKPAPVIAAMLDDAVVVESPEPVPAATAAPKRRPHRLTRAAHPVVTDGATHPVTHKSAHPVASRRVKADDTRPAERTATRKLEHA